MKNCERYKNPYFWFGILGIIFTAGGVKLEDMTSWNILFDNIMNILESPFLLLSVAMAITGVFVDPTTKGLKDCEVKKELNE